MAYVIWTKRNNLKLRVLGPAHKYGQDWLVVCKATCPNPAMGQFRVLASDVVPV